MILKKYKLPKKNVCIVESKYFTRIKHTDTNREILISNPSCIRCYDGYKTKRSAYNYFMIYFFAETMQNVYKILLFPLYLKNYMKNKINN
jgi:hypothetical protein